MLNLLLMEITPDIIMNLLDTMFPAVFLATVLTHQTNNVQDKN